MVAIRGSTVGVLACASLAANSNPTAEQGQGDYTEVHIAVDIISGNGPDFQLLHCEVIAEHPYRAIIENGRGGPHKNPN